ncbi:MAG: Gx transporter family protein [Treponemataceae bacterium]
MNNLKSTAGKKNSFELLSFLAGLIFFCASIEQLVPRPLPFFRLGLSHGVLLIGTKLLSFKFFLLLLILKVLGQGIISGMLFSYVFIFSLFGSLASGLLSFMLVRIAHKKISFVGISVLGAFASNSAQLLLAYFFVFGSGTLAFAPFLLSIGLITSLVLGIFVTRFTENSIWYKNFFVDICNIKDVNDKITNNNEDKKIHEIEYLKNKKENTNFNKDKYFFIAKIILFVLVMLANFFFTNIFVKFFIFLFSLLLCLISKVRLNIKAFLIFAFSMMLVNIFHINGKLLFEFFNIKITSGALILSLEKIFTFQSMLFFSKWIFASKINFSGRFGFLLSKSFDNFNFLLSKRHELDKNNLIKSLDNILLEFEF